MSVKPRWVTAEELLEMPAIPGKNVELVDGEVVEALPASLRQGLIATMLAGRLSEFAQQHRLGFAAGDNDGYVLRRNPDNVRSPDVSFIARERMPGGGDLDRYVEGPPTLAVEIVSPNDRAVEIVSPNDRAVEIDERVQDYLAAGTRQVWVLRPNRRAVSVYFPDADTRELGPDAILDGGDVLPGFSVRVGDLFEIR